MQPQQLRQRLPMRQGQHRRLSSLNRRSRTWHQQVRMGAWPRHRARSRCDDGPQRIHYASIGWEVLSSLTWSPESPPSSPLLRLVPLIVLATKAPALTTARPITMDGPFPFAPLSPLPNREFPTNTAHLSSSEHKRWKFLSPLPPAQTRQLRLQPLCLRPRPPFPNPSSGAATNHSRTGSRYSTSPSPPSSGASRPFLCTAPTAPRRLTLGR